MITETLDRSELLTAIDEPVSQLVESMSSLNESQINVIPFENSWTAGQLLRHVTMSTNAMGAAMRKKTKPAERDPGEKIPGLKKVFLDFSRKMKSPDFIVPEKGRYERQTAIDELNKSFDQFKESANNANLIEIAEDLPLGAVTKLEILHFVLFHTQRHLHQMNKICEALNKQN